MWAMNAVQRKLGKPFETISAPQPADIMAAAAKRVVSQLEAIQDDLLPYFEEAAQQLIKSRGAEKALCAALAQISGFDKPPPPTSLLSNSAGFMTFELKTQTAMRAKGFAWSALRGGGIAEDAVESIKGMKITKDSMSVVFDVPTEHIEAFKDADFSKRNMQVFPVETLPELEEEWGDSWGGGGGSSKGGGKGKGSKGGKGKGSKGGKGDSGKGKGKGGKGKDGGKGKGGKGKGKGGRGD